MKKTKTLTDENGRICTDCKQYKLWHNFYPHKSTSTGYQSRCVDCSQKRGKKQAQQKEHLRLTYGLSYEAFQILFEAQNGQCAICFTALSLFKDSGECANVDHSHLTNKIRGLLCSKCNSMLGHAKDNPKILEAGAAYLRRN